MTEVVVAVATTRGLDMTSAEAMIRAATAAMVVADMGEEATAVAEAGMEAMAAATEAVATRVVDTRVEGMVVVDAAAVVVEGGTRL